MIRLRGRTFPAIVVIVVPVVLALVAIMLLVTSTPIQALPVQDPLGPVCPWMDTAKSPDERAQLLLAASTFDQKIRWLDEQAANNPTQTVFSGVVYSGTQVPCTPIIQYTDGPAAISGGGSGITAFPSQTALAATWDTILSRAKGKAHGYEAFHKHRNVLLGPGLSSGRVPMLGRTSEYMGEDSLLAGVMAGAMVRGVQEDNPNEPVEAVLKHYIANEQELDRNNSSSNIDERALHEIYALPFEVAIAEGDPGGVMCSFNQVNGVWACEDSATLGGILKTDIGFKGWVVSDFGSVHSTVGSLIGGLDQELNRPRYYTPISLTAALAAGQITEAQIDEAAFRVVRAHFAAGLFDVPLPPAAEPNVSTPENQAVGLQVALEGSVLLKNKDGILPLSNASHRLRIAVIGPTASITPTGGISAASVCAYTTPGVPCTPIAPLGAITARAAQDGHTVVFNDGSNLDAAATTAAGANVAIVFATTARVKAATFRTFTRAANQHQACSRLQPLATPISKSRALVPSRSAVPSLSTQVPTRRSSRPR
jgi:beta-glucosidase